MTRPRKVLLRGVTKRYRRAPAPALDRLDLELSPATVTALVGANGSGKSTLLRLLAGLLDPTEGEVEVLGAAPRRGTLVMRSIGYAASDDRLCPDLSVIDNLCYRACIRGLAPTVAESAAHSALAAFELDGFAARRPASLSAGERQRVLLAAAMAHDPEVLLLDEPSTALDIVAQSSLHELLEESPSMGRTVLLATHHLEEVWLLARDLVVLSAGRLVYTGPTRALADSLDGLRASLRGLFAGESACAA